MYHNDTDEKLQHLCATNDELNTLLKEYEEENKFLVSQITHEIRNPLTLIYSTLQLIEHKNPDIAQITYWSSLKDDMKDVFSLLDRLSEYNHCDNLTITEVNMEHMIKTLARNFKPYMNAKKASIGVSIDKKAISHFQSYPCDETKMKEVFVNLIKNALEAVDENGRIQIDCSLEEDGMLVIAISNTGAAISAEDLPRIFLPFMTTKSSGTGLGLPTAKRIILSHNGTIDVASDDTKTAFTIKLPIGGA